jgi:hypothetical protein
MIGISSPFIHRQNYLKICPVNDHNFRTVLDRSYPQYLRSGVNNVYKLLADQN